MRTWVLWTHYECEVEVALYGSQDECYQDLKGWLDGDCDDEDEGCGHPPLSKMTNADILNAIEYHFDELSWSIEQREVPAEVVTTANGVQVPVSPDRNDAMPVTKATELMSRLESFSDG